MPADLEFIARPFLFRRRPSPVPGEFRPDYKIALLCSMLQISSRAGKSSLRRLHILNWAVRNPAAQRDLVTAREAPPLFAELPVRFEATFSRAIDLALAEKLVQWTTDNRRIGLTERGRQLATQLADTPDCLRGELEFLNELGKSITEDWTERVLKPRGSK